MVFDYVVTLRNTNRRTIDLINLLLVLIGIVFIAYRIIVFGILGSFIPYSPVLLLLLLTAGYVITRIRKKKFLTPALGLYIFGWLIILCTTITIYEKIFGILLIALYYFEETAKSNLEIGFSKNYIQFNNLLSKRYNWSQFSNIILKDNILTLDFKNNRIYQRETIDEESDCDEDEFNAFCREQLNIANNRQ
ncbi:MAG: hypothetical protein EKK37_17800 [Sphingobacteriales bacterium]|nr:MAG: hypothetical protein EKK37_17800 [Sphingobacteriales bacterium]